jgi:hypothetical protein
VSAAVEESKLTRANNPVEPEKEDKNDELELFSILPTPNKNAKTPQDCYDLTEVLGVAKSEIERFTGDHALKFAEATLATVKEWQANGIYSEYVCERLLNIANSKSTHQFKMNKFKLLAYMNYLMAIYKCVNEL